VSDKRSLPFEGAINFRDIGGYPSGVGRRTRWGRVYRSDSLAELTEDDLQRLEGLTLFGICDFRIPEEVRNKPDRLPEGHSMQVLNPGFLPENTDRMLREVAQGTITPERIVEEVTGHYRHFAERHVANYIPYFRMILEADGQPVLIHCTSGKDRTGWGIALTLLAAGCDEAVVVSDYVLTDAFRRDVAFLFPGKVQADVIDTLTSANPIYIEAALAELRRIHGAGDGWMSELGLDQAERRRLRELLSEPGEPA
jgi:protein-tyrosine phosphatase